jgi:hypothetical protein
VRQNEAEDNMALTKSFKDLVQRHIAEDPAYGEAPLREGIRTPEASSSG